MRRIILNIFTVTMVLIFLVFTFLGCAHVSGIPAQTSAEEYNEFVIHDNGLLYDQKTIRKLRKIVKKMNLDVSYIRTTL